MVDGEVKRVSADAVRAIAKATELFVQQLAARALQHAQASKRKNFRAPDVAHLAGRDRRVAGGAGGGGAGGWGHCERRRERASVAGSQQAGRRRHARMLMPTSTVAAHLSCSRLVDMGLREVLEQQGGTSGGTDEAENAAAHKQRSTKRQKQDEAAAAGTRQITAFFAGGTA